MAAPCLQEIDVAILAGGLGTRLRSVIGELPKVLARIGGVSVLELLLESLRPFSPRKVVLCLGYRGDAVERHLAELRWSAYPVVAVVEARPLGTAGALRHAGAQLESDPVLVVNGDSFVNADLCEFLEEHKRVTAQGSLLCCRVADAGRYGTVVVGGDSRISEFREKSAGPTGVSLVSAGVYLLGQDLMQRIASTNASSLERDVFPQLSAGTLYCHAVEAPLLDIGTPESYANAAEEVRHLLDRVARQRA